MTTYDEFRAEITGEPDTAGASSWAELDLEAVLNGTWTAPRATLMTRTDGACLLYPGHVHTMQGESESGKSFLAQAEAVRVLQAGGTVLYLDFESDQGTVITRMLSLGATPAHLRAGLSYRRPEHRPDDDGPNMLAWQAMLDTPYDLAVLDGITEAFSVWGVDSMDNDAVTRWGRAVPKQIAASTRAAVVCIDHVTKSAEGRGRFAIGAQAKMSYLTGASYSVEVIEPMGKGMRGVLSVRIGKDRPGAVRPVSGPWRKADRTQEAARAVFDSTADGIVQYTLDPPEDGTASGTASNDWKPTGYMERVSRAFEAAPGHQLSKRAVRDLVSGASKHVDAALAHLEQDGHIAKDHPMKPYRLLKSYRENPNEPITSNVLDLAGRDRDS